MIIKNATLINMLDIYRKRMDIIIRDGKIAGITANAEASLEDRVIDAAGAVVTPGFVECHSAVGIRNQVHRENNDGDDAEPVSPQLRAIDALDFSDEGFLMAARGGITTLLAGPGTGSLIGGTFCAVKTAGENPSSRILMEEAAFQFSLCGEPRKRFGGKGRSPQTRMGSAAMIREALFQAREAKRRLESGQEGSIRLADRSLMRVFEGMPVKITAFQANDIVTAIRLAEEFGLTYTVEGAYDAIEACEGLDRWDVRFVTGPLYGGGYSLEERNRRLELAGEMEKRGLHLALTTWHPKMNGELFPYQLAMVHSHGMSELETLRAATLYPARYAGLEDRVGSIACGRDADLLIWEGEPLDYYGKIKTMIVDGAEQDVGKF